MPDTNPWWYNSKSGTINQQNATIMEAYLHLGLGWHGPFNSQQDAINYYNQGKAANPGWKAPTKGVGNHLGDLAASGADQVLGTDQTNVQSWFLRIGEILFGLILVGVGIAKLTGTTNAISKAVRAKT